MKDKRHYAGIDIGSNAVRLLIKCLNEDSSEEQLSKVQLVRIPLRLGEDAFTKGRIGKKKSKKLIALMQAYKQLMDIYEVVAYRACATSAMRDAENGQELINHILRETGINIEIIDGREEAKLISNDLLDKSQIGQNQAFLYVDVGGGSTELNLVQDGVLQESRSFNIGTIRQLNGRVEDDVQEDFRLYLSMIKASYPNIQIVGTGGNINKLVRLGAPAERGKLNVLPTQDLHKVYNDLIQYSSEERMIRFRLKPDRADVIIPASEIFLLVCDTLSAENIWVPTKGLSDGIIESVHKAYQSTI